MIQMTLWLALSVWSVPVHVLHEMKPCVTYKGALDSDHLVIEAEVQPGWHTFAIDNERRAAEKLAGKPSLGIDQPTLIQVGAGLELAGPWLQLPPKDFSKPALRWFSWGFEDRAVFAAKIRRTGPGPVPIGIRGQACTATTCKNIDVTLSVPITESKATVDLKGLIPTH